MSVCEWERLPSGHSKVGGIRHEKDSPLPNPQKSADNKREIQTMEWVLDKVEH